MFRILEHFNLNDLYKIVSEYSHQTSLKTQQSQPTTIQIFDSPVITPTKSVPHVSDYSDDTEIRASGSYSIDNSQQRTAFLSMSPTMTFQSSSMRATNYEYATPRLAKSHIPAVRSRNYGSDHLATGRLSLDYSMNFSLEGGEDRRSTSPTLISMSGTPMKIPSPVIPQATGYPDYSSVRRRPSDGISITCNCDECMEKKYDFALTIVGKDSQGNLLLCINKNDGWTFLDVFILGTLELEQLFCWNETVFVTSASFNAAMKIIGVTVKRAASTALAEDVKLLQRSGASKDSAVYQSFIFCADDRTPTKYVMSELSIYPQRVQFLFDENTTRKSNLAAAPTPTKAVMCSYTSYFLVTTLSQSLTVYNIQVRVKKSLVTSSVHEETTIHKSPRKDTLIAGEHVWSKYESKTKLLYYIMRLKAGKSKDGLPAYTLVRVPMGETRFRANAEWVMSQCFTVPQIVATNPCWDTESPFPYTPRRRLESLSTVAPLPSVSVVTLNSPGSACLCIQHEFDMHDAENVLVPISVVHIATQTRIDYSIPVSKRATKAKQFGQLRVLFDAVSDYLLVYIPGVFLHLLDLSLVHNPTAGISFEGVDATPIGPQVPGSDGPDDFYSIAPFPLSHLGSGAGNSSGQNSFLDLRTGMIYDYSFDRKFIVGLVGGKGSATKVDPVKVLHMAMIHMQDDEVVERIVTKILSSSPELASPALFKEYILGETYRSVKALLPPSIFSGVPPTAVDQNSFISDGLNEIKFLKDISVVPMTSPRGGYGFKCIPSYQLRKYWRHTERYSQANKSLYIEQKEDNDIFSVFGRGNSNSTVNDFVLQPNTAYLKPFYEMMKWRSSGRNVDESQIKTPSGEYLDKVILVMSRRILRENPKTEHTVAQSCAEKYHHFQCKSVDILFSYILEQVPDVVVVSGSDDVTKSGRRVRSSRAMIRQRRSAFCVMENFLCALIEMGGVLLPQGFSKKFLELGYACLQKAIFLQYIEREMITVTKEFVWSLYENGVHSKDREFFYLVMCKLSTESVIDILLSKKPPPLFFVEYLFSRYPKVLNSNDVTLDESSPFYPLSLTLQAFRKGTEELKRQQLQFGVSEEFRLDEIELELKEGDYMAQKFEAVNKMIDDFYFYRTLDLE